MRHNAIAVLLALAVAGPAAADTIRVGMSGGYFPFTFVQAGQAAGLRGRLHERHRPSAPATRSSSSTMSFSGLIGALQAKRIDTVANQITITPEREAQFVFTQPYVYDGAQIVTRRATSQRSPARSRSSGKTVAVNLGSNFEQLLRDLPNADEITIKTYESNIEQDTALGRVDAFVMDRVSSAQVIAKSPLPLAACRPALLARSRTRCPSATTPPARRCATRSTPPSPRSRRTARSRRSRRSGSRPTSPSPPPDGHDDRCSGLDLDYMLGLVPVILQLCAADPRHGPRLDGARAGPRLGAGDHPRAEACR